MDYKRYPALMERYQNLCAVSIDPQETQESLIKKLIELSREKKQILVEANDIIREHITKYEKEPNLLDEAAAAVLEEFLVGLTPAQKNESGSNYLDPSISLRVSKLLLRYYQSMSPQDPEQIVRLLQQCALYDLILKDHQDDHESTPFAIMAERYLGEFDSLSDKAKRRLVHILTIGGYNRKDLTFGLVKYRENEAAFMDILRKIGEDDLTIQYYYALFKTNALAYALQACFLTEAAEKRGVPLSEPLIDLEREAPTMEFFQQALKEILESELAHRLLYDRVSVKFCIAQTDYHLGKITLEELLARMEEYRQPQEDYSSYEKSSALLTGIPCYMDYLCGCGSYDKQYVLDKSMHLIEHVLKQSEDLSQYAGATTINRAGLQMISTASGFLDFDFFKHTVLNITIYANKELYVHTMMVKEISLVLLDYILDHDPRYLDGVAGYSWEYCRDHKQEIMDLMENCALLHDIGKYFCLDIVNNSSRSLTDDEFDIIKEHPTNFSKIYQGPMDPQMECIRDCAELHHLWYNEAGGYPRRSHTANKPFVNILTIADCTDAATDNIGRPYGFGKSLETVMGEFDAERDTRYSGYVSDLLHIDEIRQRIQYVIRDRRQEIYCGVYLK